MLPEMSDTVRVKRLNGRRCKAGDVGELHAIFHMDCSHATRLQGAQQFRGQIVHLTEELCIIRVMAEVIVRGRIFVMVAERDTSHIQVNAVRWPVPDFFHTVVVDGRVIVSLDFHSLTSYRSLQVSSARLPRPYSLMISSICSLSSSYCLHLRCSASSTSVSVSMYRMSMMTGDFCRKR